MTELAQLVLPKLSALVDCLGERLEAHSQAPLCYLGILAGASAAHDYIANDNCMDGGTDGQGWVRMVGLYPTLTFPQQVVNAPCGSLLALSCEMGIIRTVLGIDEENPVPSAEAQVAMSLRQIDEQMVMYEALTCCYAASDIRLGVWTPIGPMGMAIGGAWSFTIEVVGDAE